jgi:hypothetical protein
MLAGSTRSFAALHSFEMEWILVDIMACLGSARASVALHCFEGGDRGPAVVLLLD